ncbi:MAG: T9SS type A sorting domain-containing protein [Bacteroidetes bacterium]|nr:T9SS type A sorting domain-containing protein [Bacteroidota bacterium]
MSMHRSHLHIAIPLFVLSAGCNEPKPVACNGSSSFGPQGQTGLDITGTSNAVPAGPGNPYCPPITVNADDLYYLFVNNYTTSSTGFEFLFGGTAQLDCGLPIGLGIGNWDGAPELLIVPSPATGEAWVSGAERVEAVDLFDGAGRVVLHSITDKAARVRLDLDHLSPGTYVVRVTAKNKAPRFGKLVVE